MTWLRERIHEVTATEPQHTASSGVRLVFVQYGDYSEAYGRLIEQNGAENYYAQRYTLDFVAELARSERVSSVTVVTFSRDEALQELAPGLRTAGLELYPQGGASRHKEMIRLVASLDPTHLIVSAPIVPLLRWGMEQEIPVLPLFADSFRGDDLRTQVRNARLAFVLNDPRIRFVANHNLAASLDLARIGVIDSKIVPYDWPAVDSPAHNPAKQAPTGERGIKLLYVGMVCEAKGVGDLLRAVAELVRGELDVTLDVIGQSRDGAMQALCAELQLEGRVRFLGMRPHAEVRRAMREADVVVVPSRHEYPEGLPMTLYEGLCSRTPLVVSDHPMFQLRIRDDENALVFRAGDPSSLAARVRQLIAETKLYERLSENAVQAAEGYLCPLKWDRLIEAWLDPAHGAEIQSNLLSTQPVTAQSA
ncbi:MAG TPA: glycosyltransferase family 4 protein [Polyangiales bacterium]|nr:glycosyltransferase family 4 protein [Polyangiales bacterium]